MVERVLTKHCQELGKWVFERVYHSLSLSLYFRSVFWPCLPPVNREEVRGTNGFLKNAVVSCNFLQKSAFPAGFCEKLRFPASQML